MTYQIHSLDFEFRIKDDEKNPNEITDTIIVNSPRATANISTYGGSNSTEANFVVWGLSRDLISKLTQLQMWNGGRHYSSIIVKADGVTCYEGEIVNCVADFNQAPDIPLTISCQPCAFLSLSIAMPFSFKGEIQASEIIQTIIKPFNMTLTNVGVTSSLKDPYITGSPFQQILSISNSIGCYIEFTHTDIYIAPPNTPRSSEIIQVSPSTGLIGYPYYFGKYLTIKTYFNTSYRSGNRVHLETYLPLATGDYTIGAIIHNLSCQLPNGAFESNLILYKD